MRVEDNNMTKQILIYETETVNRRPGRPGRGGWEIAKATPKEMNTVQSRVDQVWLFMVRTDLFINSIEVSTSGNV